LAERLVDRRHRRLQHPQDKSGADSTAPIQRRPSVDTLRGRQVLVEPEPAQLDPKELESFLVNFVVEHTGYPPEIVELDADLEADLGIDSIKKAQLFGELGEYFDVEPSEDLSLDDFPTLRHVLDFLIKAQGGVPPGSGAP